jgi:hypothetical protein
MKRSSFLKVYLKEFLVTMTRLSLILFICIVTYENLKVATPHPIMYPDFGEIHLLYFSEFHMNV